MKTFFTAFVGLVLLAVTSSSYALEAGGWRFNFTQSADGESPITLMEVEFLHDDDASAATPDVDALESDLGYSICGWDRTIVDDGSPDYSGVYQVGCDTLTTNRRGDPNVTIAIASDWRPAVKTRRQINTVIDNNFLTWWTTSDKVTSADNFFVQYTIKTGSGISRTLPDVTSYAITVPVDVVTTNAPVAWGLQYFDATVGNWLQDHSKDSNDVNWNNAANVWKVSSTYYLKEGTSVRLWDGSKWGNPLTGTALTAANTAISESGVLVAKRLEFSL